MKHACVTTSPRRRGFTLMEVLMAILILSIVLPALMKAYTICGDIAGLSRQRAEALAVAQSEMDELIATAEWQNGLPSGEEQPGPTNYSWSTQLGDFDEANTQVLTVIVNWQHAGQQQEVRLDTVVYIPDQTTTTTGTGLP
jgi:type II secretion system protein I